MLSSPINSYIPDVIVSVSTLKETQLFKNISFIIIFEIEGAIKKIVPFIFLYFYVIIVVEKIYYKGDMGMHQIEHLTYHCSVSEKSILKDINRFAYDPQETSGYHGGLKFHRDIVCKNYDEAMKKIEELDNGWYDDHAVMYRDGRKKYWLVKVEWHC